MRLKNSHFSSVENLLTIIRGLCHLHLVKYGLSLDPSRHDNIKHWLCCSHGNESKRTLRCEGWGRTGAGGRFEGGNWDSDEKNKTEENREWGKSRKGDYRTADEERCDGREIKEKEQITWSLLDCHIKLRHVPLSFFLCYFSSFHLCCVFYSTSVHSPPSSSSSH